MALVLCTCGFLGAVAYADTPVNKPPCPQPPGPVPNCKTWNSETCEWEGEEYEDACGNVTCEEPEEGMDCCGGEVYDPSELSCCGDTNLYDPLFELCCDDDTVAGWGEVCCDTTYGGNTAVPEDECERCDDDTVPGPGEVCCYDPGYGETTATPEEDCCDDGIAGAGEVCCNGMVTPEDSCCDDGTIAGAGEVCCGEDGGTTATPEENCCDDGTQAGAGEICCYDPEYDETTATPEEDCCDGVVVGAGQVCCEDILTGESQVVPEDECCGGLIFDPESEECCDDETIAGSGEICCIPSEGGDTTAKTFEECCADNDPVTASGYGDTLCRDSSFNLNAQGGSGQYTYSPSASGIVDVSDDGEVTGVNEGTVTITITDENDCEATVEVEVVNSKCEICKREAGVGTLSVSQTHSMTVGQTFTPTSFYVTGSADCGSIDDACPRVPPNLGTICITNCNPEYYAVPASLTPTTPGTYTIDVYAWFPQLEECVEQKGADEYVDEKIGEIEVTVCAELSASISQPVSGTSYPLGPLTFTANVNPSGGSCSWYGTDITSGSGVSYTHTFTSTGSKYVGMFYEHEYGCDSVVTPNVPFKIVGIASVQGTGINGVITSTTSSPGATETIYVYKGDAGAKITLTAAKDPSNASWPAGQPVWSGATAVSGNAASATVPIDTVSSSSAGTVVEVSCGTSVKKIKIVVFTVDLINPAGNSTNDPVLSPIDGGDGSGTVTDGANEFTFSAATNAQLKISFKATVAPTGVDRSKIVDKVKFAVSDIGSQPTWVGLVADGGASVGPGTDTFVAAATFSGLPTQNSAFGRKAVSVSVANVIRELSAIEVFYPKTETNNSSSTTPKQPNWYFFWMQTSARTGTSTASVAYAATSGTQRSEYIYADRKIILRDDASAQQIPAWGSPKGIDTFAWTLAHEQKHHNQLTGFWPTIHDLSLDTEFDWLPDAQEPSYMSGRPYDPTKMQTYPDLIGYFGVSSSTTMLNDVEDINMRSQTISNYPLDPLWTNGTADFEDWANPGKNNFTKY